VTGDLPPADAGPGPDPLNTTSWHARRAEDGDRASLDWIVRRLSPVLLAQAAHRLGPKLRALYDPEDVVDEVWAVALPRLADLTRRDGRSTPVLLRFLATTLLYRVNDLVRRHVTGPDGRRAAGGEAESALARLSDDASGALQRVVREETRHVVTRTLEELEPADREILVLRAIEQNSNQTAAMLLGLSPSAASMRYKRALETLRARLPGSVFDEVEAT
jgi:RNA polymerase sigma-70 factor (ECF subfamily)